MRCGELELAMVTGDPSFDEMRYIASVNALTGLAGKLGLSRVARQAKSLQQVLEEARAGSAPA